MVACASDCVECCGSWNQLAAGGKFAGIQLLQFVNNCVATVNSVTHPVVAVLHGNLGAQSVTDVPNASCWGCSVFMHCMDTHQHLWCFPVHSTLFRAVSLCTIVTVSAMTGVQFC
jgi:hypothetical protein